MGTIRILEPVSRRSLLREGSVRSVESLQGKVVALLSNEWRCVQILFKHLPGPLRSRFGVKDTFKEAVALSLAGPPALLDDIARRADAVIVAMAN